MPTPATAAPTSAPDKDITCFVETAQEARAIMAERFPEETSFGFTVDEWKNLSWLAEQL